MSMYGKPEGGSAVSLDLEVTRAELHAMVLARVFGGLGQVGKTQMAELGEVLTRFMLALRPFKVPAPSYGRPLPDLKHAVVVNYVKSIDITGNGGIYVRKPCTRIVIFSVRPQHWASALQKSGSHCADEGTADAASGAPDSASSTGSKIEQKSGWFDFGGKPKPKPEPKPPKREEKINFTLNSTVIELELNDALYNGSKAKFEAIFKNLVEDDEALSGIAEMDGLNALGRNTCTVFPAVKA
ncbi:hypothetical protein B0H67DRAFT_566834 [Lasiosphaeris hirsuta]|uniref:Uncharacterized protein n=1 Tax=Lasiosphaeris hirsuta TaxID=260670 RepID=A0AA40BDI4_9PEZI|nr:hypothetical protein B0H67DRAFT_566834 [Lasiosphaeris hirsuta]